MAEPALVTLTVTAPNADTLASLVRTLVEERLAACANVAPTIHSVYRWEGTVEQGDEALAFVHTSADRVGAAMARIAELHPDDVPQILALPVATAWPEYARWAVDATR